MNRRLPLAGTIAITGIAVASVIVSPSALSAQTRSITLPAMPLDQALQRIAAETGEQINIDPDAVRGLISRPVVDARDAADAVRQATRGLPIARQQADDGSMTVASDIIVTARRDEAETSVLVRGATTSSRLGQSLRDQPRNTQVISSKLLKDQQAQTLTE
ncbi:MAG: hypothetical protein OSB00_19035, partial [Sphingomonas bacterium]|nr:hypothetical protein [Sphingomonas bacterium]